MGSDHAILKQEARVPARWMVYPAIDLRQGRVVRLMQGDPDRETAYTGNPLQVAQRWQAAGAEWLHVVNLDGAFGERSQANLIALSRVLTTGLHVQFGGGLRDLAALRRAFDLGVSRVVLGTAAVEQPELVAAALQSFGPERIAIGIDARRGFVRTHGWQKRATLTALELAQQWASRGARWLIFTDISRDGMSSGLNVGATAELARATGLDVIASGGVDSVEDVRRAYAAGLSGVIVGRALYEGRVALAAALRVGGE
jgi:phosphoribosylformimino-5-aminoimidazole carboxamide ribotide isomerase